MKRQISIILGVFLIFNMSFVNSFGEVGQVAEGEQIAGMSTITESDVSRGLLFCRDYPVTVQIKGVSVPTAEKEVPPVIIGSRTLIPVRAFFEAMGAIVDWDPEKRVVSVKNQGVMVELTIDSSITKVNGEEKPLEVPAMIIDHDGDGNGSTMVPLRFVSEGLGAQVSWIDSTRTANVILSSGTTEVEETGTFETAYGAISVLNNKAREKMIAIDIGHGGKDTGAIAYEDQPNELYEKDVNLEVGLALKGLLDKAGARYIFTRESDVAISLYDRPALANSSNADIFISLHNNSSDYSKPDGTEVYYYSKTNDLGQDENALYGICSKDIATLVQKEMVAILGTSNRGAKESPYLAVLNKTSMPAIIIEGAFLSNPGDFEKIKAQEYKEKYAYAVAKGLIEAMNSRF